MQSDSVQAFASLAILAMSLSSCVWQPEPQIQAANRRAALYEQQVEEGFGHIDQLPGNWSTLPR